MKPSLNGAILGQALSFEEQVLLAERAGFAGVDTGAHALRELIAARSLGGAKEFLAGHGVAPACWGLTVEWRGSAETFAEGLAELPALAEAARSLDCPRCCTWIIPSIDTDVAEFRKMAVARLGECAKVLGDHGCRLGLEWVGPKTSRTAPHDFVYRMDQLLELEAEMGEPNLGLLVDSFHWHTAGHTVAELEALRVEQVVHVHLNDAPDRPRDEQIDFERLLPGEGIIDLAGFLGALRAIGYTDYLGVETFGKELTALPVEESAGRAGKAAARVLAALS